MPNTASLRVWSTLVAAILLATFLTGTAQAQQPYGRQPQPNQPPLQIMGKVISVQPNVIEVEAESVKFMLPPDFQGKTPDAQPGKYLVALVPNKSKVVVKGIASTEQIAPRMGVKFAGKVDGMGKFQEPIKNIELVVPDRYFKSDVTLGEFKYNFKDGNITNTGIRDITVAGLVRSYRRGVLTVAANSVINAPLDPEASVSFTGNDYRLAQEGDMITARTQWFQPGKVIADDLQLQLTTPIGEKPKSESGKSSDNDS